VFSRRSLRKETSAQVVYTSYIIFQPSYRQKMSLEQVLSEIDAAVTKATTIDWHIVLKVRQVQLEVTQGLRPKYLNFLVTATSKEPHYLVLTEAAKAKTRIIV
jgi:hypothetical protein